MLRPQGYLVIADPIAPLVERDTVTCAHCQRIVLVKPGTSATVFLVTGADGQVHEEPGAFCRRCMAPVCLACDRRGTCTPWEAQLDRLERDITARIDRERMLAAAGVP